MYRLAFYIFVLVSSIHVNADVYQYHPSSRLYLGGGFNPFKPDQGNIRCITYDGIDQVDNSNGAVHTQAYIKMVKSRRELYDSVGFSASMGGSYLFLSGETSVEYENESAFQSDSLSWLLLFKSDYGRSVLRNPRLQPDLAVLPEEELYERCGSEIVTEARRGVMAYALFTINNLSESQKEKLHAKFSASFGTGIWSASAQADFRSFMSNVAAVSNVSIKVNAVGGEGITSLASLLDEAGNPDLFAKYNRAPVVLANYIRGMGESRAVPIQFVTMHLKSFVPSVGSQFTDFKSRQVAELFNWYQDISSSVARLRTILLNGNSNEFELTSAQRTALNANAEQYVTALNNIFEVSTYCFMPNEVAKCQVPTTVLNLNPIHWPNKIDNGKCQQLREFALSSGLTQDNAEYRMAARRNFAPHIVFSHDMKASIDGWHRCEDLLQ